MDTPPTRARGRHAVATAIMLFFALCGAYILAYLRITEAAFKIAGSIILFLVALEMLAAKRQQRKRAESTGSDNAGETSSDEPDRNNLAIYPLAIPLLAGPSAIMSVIVVNAGFGSALASTLIGYAALLAAMVATGIILCLTVIAEGWLNAKITMVFSRITGIILAALSVQYVIDGLTAIGMNQPQGLASSSSTSMKLQGDIIAVADVMLDAGLPEIASAGGHAADHRPCSVVDPQVIVE